MAQMRAWRGPALLSFGFRPFFLGGAIHAALMVALWVPWYLGLFSLPSALPPNAWHAHELLFGYIPAVAAGFLLTAIPNWTGRLPVVGLPLAGLFTLWLIGRVAIAVSVVMSPVLMALFALAFPVVLAGVLAREIAAGRNWRNLKVLAGLSALTLAQVLFYAELWSAGEVIYAAYLAAAAAITLIMIVGGRIIPSFTANWIKRNNPGREPTPFGTFDKLAMVLAVIALAAWVLLPAVEIASPSIALLLIATGLLQFIRQCRWAPHRTLAEPLLGVLHLAYAFVPVGFILAGLAAWRDDSATATGAIHAWTVGAVGLMTIAVMTRATRGHTGQPLAAPPTTVAIYAGIVIAAAARIVAVYVPEWTAITLSIAAIAWVLSFAGFAVTYGPLLIRPRPASE